ncbi:terminase, partial [bacterium]
MLGNDLSIALDPARLMMAAGLTPDPWQAALLRSTAQQQLLLCTRQAGKSTTTAALALYEAIYNPPALVLLLSPSLRQSKELFAKVLSHYRAMGKPVAARAETTLEIELENGSRIIALPGNEETIRGFSGVRLAVIDEASRVPDALYFSIRPMLAVSGGRLIALTTPFGKRGFFFDEWEKGGEAWRRVRVTATDCPRITQAFLDEERRAMGDGWFLQEYMCDFRDT